MASAITEDTGNIGNQNNFCKYVLLIMEPCSEAFFYVYKWLYSWNSSNPEDLEDHLDKTPSYDTKNKKLKNYLYLNQYEKDRIRAMKGNVNVLKGVDISLLYKLIQCATNSKEIASPYEEVWVKGCSQDLEHLLFLLKEKRNLVGHKNKMVTDLSDTELEDVFKETKFQINEIIEQAGVKGNIDAGEVNRVKKRLQDCIKDIHTKVLITSFDKHRILEFLKKEDIEKTYLMELIAYFMDQLMGFIAPSFLHKSDNSISNLKHIFQLIKDYKIAIICGEAGCGKTSLTRFLLYKWISGDENTIEGITDFEIVFRIPCGDVHSRDLTLFYERELKNSRTLFPDTTTLDYQLRKCNILWIMDGFDESTAEFKGFLKAILQDLSENHKIIITTRPSSTSQLLDMLEISEKQICVLTLQKFNENQIKEVAQKREIQLDKFDYYYKQLQNEDKKFLENPLNLNLVLQLWSTADNKLFKQLNASKLYERLFEKQINELIKRLKDRTHLEDSELEKSIRKWFIEGLCKFALLSILQNHFQLELAQSHIYELTDDAMNRHLIASYCLSTFLDTEESSEGSSYHFRHVIQKETLASYYLKYYEDNELKHICNFVHFDNPFIKILTECHDYDNFLILFTYFYESRNPAIFCSQLLKIAVEKKERFDCLKRMFANSEKKLNVRGSILTPRNLKNLVHSLEPELTHFNCYLDINQKLNVDWKFDAMNEYKDKVNFILRYNFFIENDTDLIGMVAEVAKVYSDSRFSPRCFSAFLFIVITGGDPERLLKALIDITKQFHTLTIEFEFGKYKGPNVVFGSDLVSQFASQVKVKILQADFYSLSEFHFQLLNAVKVDYFTFYTKHVENETLLDCLKKINFKMQTNLLRCQFVIKPQQLKCLYKNIPQEIARKIWVLIFSPIALEDVPRPQGKKLWSIIIDSFNYEIYEALRKIAIQVASYELT